MSAHINAQSVEKNITKYGLSNHWAAFRHAGGTTISDGNGINELSMVINSVIVR